MSSEQDNLYIALYTRSSQGQSIMPDREDTYHWALIVGPEVERPDSKGTRYHARITNASRQAGVEPDWMIQESPIAAKASKALVARILIAKVKNTSLLNSILQTIPVRAKEQKDWNCVYWVKEAYETVLQHERSALPDGKALGIHVEGWKTVRDGSFAYAQQKEAEVRKAKGPNNGVKMAATWDMLSQTELNP